MSGRTAHRIVPYAQSKKTALFARNQIIVSHFASHPLCDNGDYHKGANDAEMTQDFC